MDYLLKVIIIFLRQGHNIKYLISLGLYNVDQADLELKKILPASGIKVCIIMPRECFKFAFLHEEKRYGSLLRYLQF